MKMTLTQQKEKKRELLLKSAFDSFLLNGIAKTSIDEIVNKANLAKGTFYLYFKNKDDLLASLIKERCYQLIKDSYYETEAQEFESFDLKMIYFIDYIIDYFVKNPDILRLIQRNFSIPENLEIEQDDVLNQIFNSFLDNETMKKMSPEEGKKVICIIIEMVGSVCYSSIIEKKPATIEEIKPTLYLLIKKMLL